MNKVILKKEDTDLFKKIMRLSQFTSKDVKLKVLQHIQIANNTGVAANGSMLCQVNGIQLPDGIWQVTSTQKRKIWIEITGYHVKNDFPVISHVIPKNLNHTIQCDTKYENYYLAPYLLSQLIQITGGVYNLDYFALCCNNDPDVTIATDKANNTAIAFRHSQHYVGVNSEELNLLMPIKSH